MRRQWQHILNVVNFRSGKHHRPCGLNNAIQWDYERPSDLPFVATLHCELQSDAVSGHWFRPDYVCGEKFAVIGFDNLHHAPRAYGRECYHRLAGLKDSFLFSFVAAYVRRVMSRLGTIIRDFTYSLAQSTQTIRATAAKIIKRNSHVIFGEPR